MSNNKSMSVLDVDRMMGVLQRRCDSHRVALKWAQQEPIAATNAEGMIILPAVEHPVTKDAMDQLYGHVIHECGHHARPDVFKIMEALPENTPDAVRALLNIVEDDGMERQLANEYRGDRAALAAKNNIVIKRIVPDWQKNNQEAEMWAQVQGEELKPHMFAPQVACCLGQLSRNDWDAVSTADGQVKLFSEGLHEVAKPMFQELIDEGWVERFRECETPDDSLDVAIDLYKRMIPESERPDDEECEDIREQGHSKEPAEDGEGQSSEGDSSEGQAPGQDDADGDSEGKGDEDAEGKTKTQQQGYTVPWKEATISEHTEWKPKNPDDAAGNIGIDWRDYQGNGSVGLMPASLINVVDLHRDPNQTVETRNGSWYGNCGTPKSFMPNNKESKRFGSQVRRYLQAQARTRVSREKYHGRLDKQSVIRLALPPIDGGEWNKRVFYDFEATKHMNTAIHVLTDWSGSMNGNKMVYAADASGRLVYVMDRILKVPVQLAAFTNGVSECDIGLIKRFEDRSISPVQIAENFSKFYKYSSANNDADAVMWAYRQLKKRPEQRRILIVLSDGCPAGSYTGHSHDNLVHVTNEIQREGDIELYGVGICSDAVEEYYKNHKVLHDESEINKTLFNIIKAGAYKNGR